MKTAYLDCFSGISGDMFLGALLDAGLPFEILKETLHSLPLEGYRIETQREERGHLFGTRFLVEVDKDKQVGRGIQEIEKIIHRGQLSNHVKQKSIKIFETIAREEGKIHNRALEEIHFHEVGAADSIIDIVGTLFGIEFLGIDSIGVSSLPMGSGFVETAHGRIPLPAPATVALLKGIPVCDSGLKYELVTSQGDIALDQAALPFVRDKRQSAEHQQVPQRFVQEGGMEKRVGWISRQVVVGSDAVLRVDDQSPPG